MVVSAAAFNAALEDLMPRHRRERQLRDFAGGDELTSKLKHELLSLGESPEAFEAKLHELLLRAAKETARESRTRRLRKNTRET